jgi:acyl-coenzyme A thioesterase PaaI-like protein
MPAATTGELRALMSRAVFARDYGFHLESADDDRCTLRVPFDERLERPGGVIGGPAFMAAADVATWLAILARLGAGDQSVTSSLVTNAG